jgi:arylsulfatase A-like enzyme
LGGGVDRETQPEVQCTLPPGAKEVFPYYIVGSDGDQAVFLRGGGLPGNDLFGSREIREKIVIYFISRKPMKHAICLFVDRLGIAYPGPYGNTWIETPAMNRLASESLLCDRYYAETLALERQWEAFFSGRFPNPPGETDKGVSEAPLTRMQNNGVRTLLVTDDARLADLARQWRFDEIIQLQLPEVSEPVDAFDNTGFAVATAQLYEIARQLNEETLLWCHLQGFSRQWDFPMAYREMLMEEGDPPPFDGTRISRSLLIPEDDPDRLRAYQEAYAGGIAVLDESIAWLHAALREGEFGAETLFLFGATRGFPLGEHRLLIGTEMEEDRDSKQPDDKLRELIAMESVHLPLMVRFPDGTARMQRSDLLLQPRDVLLTILDWWAGERSEPMDSEAPFWKGKSFLPSIDGVATPLAPESFRDRLLIVSDDGQRGLRTPAWWLHCRKDFEHKGEEACRLYLKPDDYWEINDVADRCPEVVEQLIPVLEELEKTIQSCSSENLTPLPEILKVGYH